MSQCSNAPTQHMQHRTRHQRRHEAQRKAMQCSINDADKHAIAAVMQYNTEPLCWLMTHTAHRKRNVQPLRRRHIYMYRWPRQHYHRGQMHLHRECARNPKKSHSLPATAQWRLTDVIGQLGQLIFEQIQRLKRGQLCTHPSTHCRTRVLTATCLLHEPCTAATLRASALWQRWQSRPSQSSGCEPTH